MATFRSGLQTDPAYAGLHLWLGHYLVSTGDLREGMAELSRSDELFHGRSPIGRNVRLNNVSLKVIGVLASKGANMFGDDQDDIVLMPLGTAKKRIQGSSFENVGAIMVSARTVGQMSEAGWPASP